MIQVTLLVLLSVSTITSASFTFNSTFSHPSDSGPWFEGAIPAASNVTTACATAYAQQVPCDEWIIKAFDQNSDSSPTEKDKFSNATLNALCTDACLAGLQKWRDDVREACTSEDVKSARTALARYAAEFLSYLLDTSKKYIENLYWPTCIRDL
jgi:hypothetical protein